MKPGQRLTAFYVDVCHEQGVPEMVRMKGHMARRIKELLDAEVPEAECEEAIREFVSRRASTPLALAEISVELVRNRKEAAHERPDARRRAKAWIEENGWPTGIMLVRGSHSYSHAHSVLGMEKSRPVDWPYARPTFDEIVEALEGVEL